MNPDRVGTKAALHYSLTVPAGEVRRVRRAAARTSPTPATMRIAHPGPASPTSTRDFDATLRRRRTEADEFYDAN